jgi:hypothetical protein
MANQWIAVLNDKGADWNFPTTEKTALIAVAGAAGENLEKVQDTSSRSHVDTVACNEAFGALVAKMRFDKNNYFQSPPRTAVDLALLGLSPRDPPGAIPAPSNQVSGKTRPLGDHLLEVELEIIGDMVADTKASDYGYRLYAAVVDPVLAASGTLGPFGPYVPAVLTQGAEFSYSFFTHRRREIINLPETDRGKKVCFIRT